MILIIDNINIKDILFSGACFRSKLESDGSITNILKDRVINLKQENNNIIVKSSNMNGIEAILKDYFDLNRNYEQINKEIVKNSPNLLKIVNKCKDYRILNQDSFEMCISYIISQNNNVKRIKKSVNELSKRYGKKIIFNDKEYYLFPEYDDLKDLSIEDFRNLGIGFRDKYIKDYLDKYKSLKDINLLSTEEGLKELMSVKGIGLKVASCILLFGYKRLDVFPIDTWVKKYFHNNFNVKEDQREIEKFAKEKFGKYSGLVIQYMFHYERNLK